MFSNIRIQILPNKNKKSLKSFNYNSHLFKVSELQNFINTVLFSYYLCIAIIKNNYI